MRYRLRKHTITILISSLLIFIVVIISITDRPVQISEHPPYAYEQDLYGSKRSVQARFAHAILPIVRKASGATDLESYRVHTEEKMKRNIYRPNARAIRYCSIDSTRLNGIRTYVLTPNNSGNNRAIVYLHGGAYMTGPYIEQWRMLNQLANATGCKIYLVRYSLGTEAPFPAALNDAFTAYRELLHQYSARELVLLGDSAGGGLVFSLAQKIRAEGIGMPAKIVAISPWLNLAMDHPDTDRFARKDPMLHLDDINLAAKTYAGDHDLHNPLISPVNTNFDGLPPAMLMIGTCDILFPDCLVFKRQAELSGYDLTFIKGEKMLHVWPGGVGYYPEAKRGIKQIADYIIHYPVPNAF